jgi:hypothetical protein
MPCVQFGRPQFCHWARGKLAREARAAELAPIQNAERVAYSRSGGRPVILDYIFMLNQLVLTSMRLCKSAPRKMPKELRG